MLNIKISWPNSVKFGVLLLCSVLTDTEFLSVAKCKWCVLPEIYCVKLRLELFRHPDCQNQLGPDIDHATTRNHDAQHNCYNDLHELGSRIVWDKREFGRLCQ